MVGKGYRITKNFRDKKLSRISLILEYRESFFREISGNVHVSVDFFSRNAAALRFEKVFCRERF